MNPDATGQKIRQLREARFLSVLELARRAKVSPNTIHRLERGANGPQMRSIRAIAAALEVSPAELVA